MGMAVVDTCLELFEECLVWELSRRHPNWVAEVVSAVGAWELRPSALCLMASVWK